MTDWINTIEYTLPKKYSPIYPPTTYSPLHDEYVQNPKYDTTNFSIKRVFVGVVIALVVIFGFPKKESPQVVTKTVVTSGTTVKFISK